MFLDLNELETKYQSIKQQGLDLLQIRYADIEPLFKALSTEFKVIQVGESYQRRPINKVTFGSGPIRLFMWSQMHGNESTATASLFDLMNFISAPENQAWVSDWQDKLTLQIAPMINPDGAEAKSRYNAQSIDLNRDASSLQTNEGKILNSLADDFKPHYGFNLHDQNRYYTTGDSSNTATISLLAPAFNLEKSINDSRRRAMQLAGIFHSDLKELIPGCIGKYDDSYCYRSFGDSFSSKGISTILIESGHYPNDSTRQKARWLNFMMLIRAIDAIANDHVESQSLDSYDCIPMNHFHGLVDIMLRNVNVQNQYTADFSINHNRYYGRPRIEEVGDLSHQEGLQNHDMSDYILEPLKGYFLNGPLILNKESYLEMLREGFSYFIGQKKLIKNNTGWPVEVLPKQLTLDVPKRQRQIHMIFSKSDKPALALIKDRWIEL